MSSTSIALSGLDRTSAELLGVETAVFSNDRRSCSPTGLPSNAVRGSSFNPVIGTG